MIARDSTRALSRIRHTAGLKPFLYNNSGPASRSGLPDDVNEAVERFAVRQKSSITRTLSSF